MSLEQVTKLFMWMTIINVAALVLTSVLIMVLRNVVCRKHARMFGIKENEVALAAYSYLGNYKLLVLVFNVVPYISLSLIG